MTTTHLPSDILMLNGLQKLAHEHVSKDPQENFEAGDGMSTDDIVEAFIGLLAVAQHRGINLQEESLKVML